MISNMTLEKGGYQPQLLKKNVKAIQNLVKKDHQITVEEVATALEISHGSAFLILSDHLGLSKLSARWVLKALWKTSLFRELNFL